MGKRHCATTDLEDNMEEEEKTEQRCGARVHFSPLRT